MTEMNVDRVVQLREQWLAELDSRQPSAVPVETLIDLADLVLRQADALRQLDHGLSLLEDLFSGQPRRDEARRPDEHAPKPLGLLPPAEGRRHGRRH